MTLNRFADTTRREEDNVEVDRVLEHHNRVFQGNVHGIISRKVDTEKCR